jgi:hypothetical protein
VAWWLKKHPYEVIAIMIVNHNRIKPKEYIRPFERAGLLSLVYIPSHSNMTLEQWPTLSEMIIQNNRLVVTLDYEADQKRVPWLLDEFSYQWETKFSPENRTFPCAVDRPERQTIDHSRNMMYMVNHNLNIDVKLNVSFLAMSRKQKSNRKLLIPAHTLFHKVNAEKGNMSLGLNVEECTAMWGRPPNWLLVDYYNRGDFNGSVFQVAANANNVPYNRTSCCGNEIKNDAVRRKFTKYERMWFIGTVFFIGLM